MVLVGVELFGVQGQKQPQVTAHDTQSAKNFFAHAECFAASVDATCYRTWFFCGGNVGKKGVFHCVVASARYVSRLCHFFRKAPACAVERIW